MTTVIDVPGIGPVYGKKLAIAGIETIDDLLTKAGSKQGRLEVAEQSGIDADRILEWVTRADLMQVGHTDSDRAAGVSQGRSRRVLTEVEESALVDQAVALRDDLRDSSRPVTMMRDASSIALPIRIPFANAQVLRDIAAARQISMSELAAEVLSTFTAQYDPGASGADPSSHRPRATRSSGTADAARTQSARLAT